MLYWNELQSSKTMELHHTGTTIIWRIKRLDRQEPMQYRTRLWRFLWSWFGRLPAQLVGLASDSKTRKQQSLLTSYLQSELEMRNSQVDQINIPCFMNKKLTSEQYCFDIKHGVTSWIHQIEVPEFFLSTYKQRASSTSIAYSRTSDQWRASYKIWCSNFMKVTAIEITDNIELWIPEVADWNGGSFRGLVIFCQWT